MEAGKMKFLTAGMKELTTDEEKVAARLKMLMLGFRKVRGNNDKYAYTFCLLEVVNFVNVILQVIFISTISTRYLHISIYRADLRHGHVPPRQVSGLRLPAAQLLPGIYNIYNVSTLSTQYLYLQYLPELRRGLGPHGRGVPQDGQVSVQQTRTRGRHPGWYLLQMDYLYTYESPCYSPQNHDALCLLPLNIVNEKIYLCMWVWLIFLAAASGLAVIYRSVLI